MCYLDMYAIDRGNLMYIRLIWCNKQERTRYEIYWRNLHECLVRESDALKCTESDRRPVCNLIVQRLCEWHIYFMVSLVWIIIISPPHPKICQSDKLLLNILPFQKNTIIKISRNKNNLYFVRYTLLFIHQINIYWTLMYCSP